MYQSIKDLVRTAEIQQKALSELVIEAECHESGLKREEVWQRMRANLLTMRAAIKQGENELGVRSKTQQWESSARPRPLVHLGLFLALFLC